MNGVIFTILSLAFLTAAFLAWYFTHKTREKERLIMLEKGMELPHSSENKKNFGFSFPWLKTGVLLVSLSIGLLIGLILEEHVGQYWGAPPLFLVLFGGVGMIIAHFLDKKKD
ncbi:MAG: hypothetical protein JJU13_01665 [Balneolaceae bacterium]|nr:hypothetical protein [Balneolaceae bacterium]